MYCKCDFDSKKKAMLVSINSSKVYCKFSGVSEYTDLSLCINSSKVYCKFFKFNFLQKSFFVLIVAKCIVNVEDSKGGRKGGTVLIVAKCIVNR